MKPIGLFYEWYSEELEKSKVTIPSACCLSTIGLDDYPNARFVSLKKVKDGKFIITGPISSRKGSEISNSGKVALTFWWTETERQVRIQGDAKFISDEEAEKYFTDRNRESKIISNISDQGKSIENPDILHHRYKIFESRINGKEILKPENWSGFAIDPIRIEFMQFRETRFHERVLYIKKDNDWEKDFLQP